MATASRFRAFKNVGRPDQAVRIVVGLLILLAGLLLESWWGLIGLVPLLTGLSGVCPVYGLLGVSTR